MGKHVGLIKTARYYWRRYGAIPILITQILCSIFVSTTVTGYVVLLWLTVPCGMKTINDNKYLWYGRQALFLSLGLSLILQETFFEYLRTTL